MKFFVLPLAILFAPMGSDAASLTAAATAPTAFGQQAPAQEEPSAKDAAKRAKKARKARKEHGPEVYKGTVAKERRLLTDAPGAQKEVDPADDDASQTGTEASGKEKTKIKVKE